MRCHYQRLFYSKLKVAWVCFLSLTTYSCQSALVFSSAINDADAHWGCSGKALCAALLAITEVAAWLRPLQQVPGNLLIPVFGKNPGFPFVSIQFGMNVKVLFVGGQHGMGFGPDFPVLSFQFGKVKSFSTNRL